MRFFKKLLSFLTLEVGILSIVIFDIIHFLWHLTVFLPKNSGRKIYIFHDAFDMDADLFLFFTTNILMLLIKIGYGVKVITKKFKAYTNTYAVLTQLIGVLIVFLDLALTIYLTKLDSNWYGWPFCAVLLMISICFIIITKKHNRNVSMERKAAGANQTSAVPLMQRQGEDDIIEQSSEDEEEDEEEEDDREEANPVVTSRV
jgi:hypothetical protein